MSSTDETMPFTDIIDITSETIGKQIKVRGFVSSASETSTTTFLKIYDGTIPTFLQVVISGKSTIQKTQFIHIIGTIVKSPMAGQEFELASSSIKEFGKIADSGTFLPLAKGVGLDKLRGENTYLRSRFQTFQAIFRIRSAIEFIIYSFMEKKHFLKTDPNILTSADCEGAGEMFHIQAPIDPKHPEPFFGKEMVGLTVSSQLPLEALAVVGRGVYTMNKSFRAERSKTTRHLAEFSHFEFESFTLGDLKSLMDFIEEIVRHVIETALIKCKTELELLDSYASKGIIQRLKGLISPKWGRLSYTEALELLIKDKEIFIKWSGIDPEEFPKWGDDLGSKCERYLAEEVYKSPIFVHDYPLDLKSFYMKQNAPDSQGRKTVMGCDFLVPGLGELVGSSVREDDYSKLIAEMERRKMSSKDLSWFIDLRRNASYPHGGAGLGFDRLVSVICGVANIRDAVPFPVSYGECDF
jgi:asparaginyl-tRNA synthetase